MIHTFESYADGDGRAKNPTGNGWSDGIPHVSHGADMVQQEHNHEDFVKTPSLA